MKIGENKFASISYTLTVDGEVVETVTAEAPLEFVFGAGFLLPQFEENLEGKVVGDKFGFTLLPGESYGEIIPEAVVELPTSVFMMDGQIEEGLLTVGNQLPMSDTQGNRMIGTIKEVKPESVIMDFNHPMAGKTLVFAGEVVGVREATEADLMMGQMAGGGCGCGCGEEGCDDKEGGCGGGCNGGCN